MRNWLQAAIKLNILKIVVGSFVVPTTLLYAKSDSSVSQEAELFSWSEDPQWLSLLMWDGSESLWDSSTFFLSPDGKEDPLRELFATQQAMRAPQDEKNPAAHAQCRFPARRAFLQKKLHEAERPSLPDVRCPHLDEWMQQHEYNGVSLVFSSSYVNNPASAFGHTLLRLHRPNNAGGGLLDDAVNFAANTDTDNPFIYAWKGLTGGFQGQFALIPYYHKIQEYAHSERRDLFEYELNLTPDEIDQLRRVLWEWGPQQMDYYYFDDNCSGILLRVLAAVRPDLNFSPHRPWVIPAVTVRTVADNKDFVKKIHNRPSSLTQFLARYGALAPEEKKLFDSITATHTLTALSQAKDDTMRARVLDAVVDYIDFVKRVAAHWRAGDLATLRLQALKERAKLNAPAQASAEADPITQPHRGHPPERMGVLAAYADKQAQLWLEWRPAYHDLISQPEGYGYGLEIEFFRTRIGVASRRAFVQQFTLLRIANTAHLPWIVRGPDWDVDLSYQKRLGCDVDCGETAATGAIGTHVGHKDLYLYSHLVGAIGHAQEGFAATGMRVGAFISPTQAIRLKTEWEGLIRHTLKKKKQWHNRATAAMAFSIEPNLEMRLEGVKSAAESSGALGLFWYF